MARVAQAPFVTQATTVALWILAVFATLFFLREAKTLLIPIALAVLISYALEPVVAWLERRRVPRVAGAALILSLILGVAAFTTFTLRDDATQLLESVPKSIERARQLLLVQLGPGAVDAVTNGLGSGSTQDAGASAGAASAPSSGSLLQRLAGAVFSLAGHIVVVLFLVLFLLASGHHVKDRVVEIAGPDPERKKTVASIIDDINEQVQRYLLVLLFTAAIVGVMTWGVLAWMGIRYAAMWGFLAGVFNSIPYFGPVIVSGGLFVAGITQGEGLTQGLQMAGAALVITSIEGWLITPPLMGKAERMSALTVFLGLLLWTWVWGAWGTILAVPMLVVMKSVADHVERLRPIGRLMAP